jgi:hypothetical protein
MTDAPDQPDSVDRLISRFEQGWLCGERLPLDGVLAGLEGDLRLSVLIELVQVELEFRHPGERAMLLLADPTLTSETITITLPRARGTRPTVDRPT